MVQDFFRPRFLGQVRLGTKILPGVNPVTSIDPTGRSSFSSPGDWLQPPSPDCVFVGYKKAGPDVYDSHLTLESNLANARAHGFTEIQETEVPPCDLAADASPWERMLRPGCGTSTFEKAVWACPGPDYERLTAEAKAAATQGCEFLFVSEGYLDPQEKQDQIQAEIAAGNKVKRVFTGVVLNPGTKSQQNEAEIWVCRRLSNVLPPPTGPASKYEPQETPPQPLPLSPEAKPDLVPVAAGAGVVAILAALIGGAFGGK